MPRLTRPNEKRVASQDQQNTRNIVLPNNSVDSKHLVNNQTSFQQVTLTVTGTNSWSTVRAVGFAYQAKSGEWRLRFNTAGTTASSTTVTLTIDGVVFKNGYNQAIATSPGTAAAMHQSHTVSNTDDIQLEASAAQTGWSVSGDVELEGQPTL